MCHEDWTKPEASAMLSYELSVFSPTLDLLQKGGGGLDI